MELLVLVFVIMLDTSRGEIIDCKIAGLGTAWSGPIYFSYMGGNIPGTTFTIRANAGENTSIAVKDMSDRVIFKYTPRSRYKIFSTTIVIEKHGFRAFDYGEEMEFYRANIKFAYQIGITQGGLKSGYLAFNEPLWALQHLHKHVRIDLFGEGTEVPFKFSLIEYNSDLHQFEDYVIVIGEVTNSPVIQLEIRDPEGKIVPMHVILRTKLSSPNEPILNIGTYNHQYPRYHYNDTTLDRGLSLVGRFTIAVVREHLGWKIYVNGELYHFFFDRYSPIFAKEVFLYGRARDEGGWNIIKLIRKHS